MSCPQDPSARLADLQAQGYEALGIEEFIHSRAPIEPKSQEELDIMERIDGLREFSIKQELFDCLYRNTT